MNFWKTALSATVFATCIGAFAGQDERAISLERGAKVYYTYCVSCHGVNGDGKGRRSAKLDVMPSNLARSGSPIEYMEMMIRKGSESIGRSRAMPPWEDELSNENIHDVVSYLNSLRRI